MGWEQEERERARERDREREKERDRDRDKEREVARKGGQNRIHQRTDVYDVGHLARCSVLCTHVRDLEGIEGGLDHAHPQRKHLHLFVDVPNGLLQLAAHAFKEEGTEGKRAQWLHF